MPHQLVPILENSYHLGSVKALCDSRSNPGALTSPSGTNFRELALLHLLKGWLTIFLLVFSTAWALTDEERAKVINDTFESCIQQVPPDLQRWLQKQGIQPDQLRSAIPRLNFHQMRKKLSTIEGFFQKVNGDATPVFTPLQEYIVSCAPSDETVNQFWQMLLDNKVRTVVALLMPTDNSSRSTAYWQQDRFPVTLSDWVIRYVSEETVATSTLFPSARLVKRVFSAQGIHSNEQRLITHIHFENWPDNGAPAHDLFCFLLDYIDTIHPWNDSPIVVHCAAGIGRSGTFVTAHSIRKEIKQQGVPEEINIPKRVIELRSQRAKLLSQTCQLQATYAAILQLLETCPASTL